MPSLDTSSFRHRLAYFPLTPGSAVHSLASGAARFLGRAGVLRPNARIHVIERDDWVLVLTPLAGSSSIRSRARDVRTHDLRAPFELGSRTLVVLDRPYRARLRSFYNKKVRNPTNLSKAALLGTMPPLTHRTTPAEFVAWVASLPEGAPKDKHLFTRREIVTAFGRSEEAVRFLDIRRDRYKLEAMLGITLGDAVHSTADAASFAPPLDLPATDGEGEGDATARLGVLDGLGR